MIITIDIGGTNTRITSFGNADPETISHIEKIQSNTEYSLWYEELVRTVKNFSKEGSIEKISIGSTGLISPDKRLIAKCAFLPRIVNKPFVDSLSHEFNTGVILNNDAVCSALGESLWGNGKDGNRVLYITISTGMGGSFIKKTQDILYIIPAEIGHTIVDLNGKICECGQKGCIGAYAHGRGLEERFLTKPEDIDDMRIWEEVAEYLTIGVINGARIFMPDTIVFSGAIVENRDYVLNKIKQLYEKRSVIRPIPNIVMSKFGDSSVIYGALAFVTKQNFTFI